MKKLNLLLFSLFKLLFIIYLLLYSIIHIAFLTTPNIIRYLIFQNYIYWPFVNLSNPNEFGLRNVYNFRIQAEDVNIGVWHYIPGKSNYTYEFDSLNNIDQHFTKYAPKEDNRPIIIYVHGNIRDRSMPAVRNLCTKLSQLNYHVFALDYRGYGDSPGIPSEYGAVSDVLRLYDLIKSYKNDTNIYFWGHSLGTGISTHAAKVLSERNNSLNGLILEAPFLNISQAIKQYVISPLFYNNPWIFEMGDTALDELDLHFNTDKNILKVNSQILIFHAEDDWLIPHDNGLDLFDIAQNNRPKNYPEVELKILDKEHGLGHCNIYMHDEIYPIVKRFVKP